MPSTLFPEIEGSGNGLVVDQNRELQALALDLARLGLSADMAEEDSSAFDERRKSSNMTECVPVPSSEHVAEIVGRQGCKIKALRAKTNTYIKTPVRGEEPVFVVTGRKEDVAAAKREILQAAEHFSQIRARRSQGHLGAGVPGQPPPPVPGQTTIQVRVPYRVVGLVVGPKGATIKRIQQQTNTYIVTPSRDNEPVFEVTGLPESVEKAREDIEAHIAMRTGGIIDNDANPDDFATNGTDTGTFGHADTELTYIKPLTNAFSPLVGPPKDMMQRSNSTGSDFLYGPTTKLSDFSPFLNNYNLNREYNLFHDQVSPDIGVDTFDSAMQQSSAWWSETSRNNNPFLDSPQRTHSFGSVSQLENGDDINDHKPAMRLRSDPLHGGLSAMPIFAPLPSNSFSSASSDGSVENSPPSDSGSSGSAEMKKKDCMICTDKDIVAALVPCGHNLFCLDCANQLLGKQPAECPVCHQSVTQAIQIKSS